MPSAGTHDYQAAREIVVTTTGNIDNLDLDGASLLLMNNASLSTIRGIRAGYAGKRISIASIGAGNVALSHQNSGSSEANRLINNLTGDSLLVAGKGTATYQYDANTDRWRLISRVMGGFISVTYDSSNFTASVGTTWTVQSADQNSYLYRITETAMDLIFDIRNTEVSGSSGFLRIKIPEGRMASATNRNIINVTNAGVDGLGIAIAAAGTDYVELFVGLGTTFSNTGGAQNTYAAGYIVIPL